MDRLEGSVLKQHQFLKKWDFMERCHSMFRVFFMRNYSERRDLNYHIEWH